jgi:hypothetical protein
MHIQEKVLSQSLKTDTPSPRVQRRRIDYIAENPNPHPYVKAWLQEPFMAEIRQNPDFKYAPLPSLLSSKELSK